MYSASLPYATHAGDYFAAIVELPWAIWLDSSGRDRYDILVAQPRATLVTYGEQTEINDVTGKRFSCDDPLDLLQEMLGPVVARAQESLFSGGAVGYCAYDLARRWVKLSARETAVDNLPDMAFGIYDWAVVIDHHQQNARLISQQKFPETAKILPEILERLQSKQISRRHDFRVKGKIKANFSREEYGAAFKKIHDYLAAGDSYQVNLAQCFTAQASGEALDVYMALREMTPAPYSAFLNLPHCQILCTSPERFLQVKDGIAETRPIKGTCQRGSDEISDAKLKENLRDNLKDRAENLMIVDLLRNDLSKSCAVGSIKVRKLFEVETYANVHHLTSTISGKLKIGKDALSLLRDCFPGGSITGAPKKRAMEIIEELESQRRGLYCGAIGYVGWDGNMDTNIAIRTMIYAHGKIQFSVGGGIVADSRADDEYRETLDKAWGMLKVLALYGGKI